MTTVGLIGPPERAEIERLAIRLEERGAEPVFLDTQRDPEISIARGALAACGEDITRLRAVYVVDLRVPSPLVTDREGKVDAARSRHALERSRRYLAAWNALLTRLGRTALVVNPPASHLLHALKPYEVAVYAQAGIPVPATVATSDPSALASGLPRGVAEWIRKGMVGGFTHTERLDVPGSPGAAAAILRGGPVMAQERISGENVRAFVVGGEMIGAAEVVPTTGRESDSRRGDSRVRRVALPEEAARHAVWAAGRWGMSFAAVDFMREARTGRYVPLECNSAPFFVNFEARTGIDVSGRLADHLLGKRPR